MPLTMKCKANHIGPESCVDGREAGGEALTGVPAGEVSSRESLSVRDADAFYAAEGSTGAATLERASAL